MQSDQDARSSEAAWCVSELLSAAGWCADGVCASLAGYWAAVHSYLQPQGEAFPKERQIKKAEHGGCVYQYGCLSSWKIYLKILLHPDHVESGAYPGYAHTYAYGTSLAYSNAPIGMCVGLNQPYTRRKCKAPQRQYSKLKTGSAQSSLLYL